MWSLLKHALSPTSTWRRARGGPAYEDALVPIPPPGWDLQRTGTRMLDEHTPQRLVLALSRKPRPLADLPSPPIFGHYLHGERSPLPDCEDLVRLVLGARDLRLAWQGPLRDLDALRAMIGLPPFVPGAPNQERTRTAELRPLEDAEARLRALRWMASHSQRWQLALVADPTPEFVARAGPTASGPSRLGLFRRPLAWTELHALVHSCGWILAVNEAMSVCLYSALDLGEALPGAREEPMPDWRGPPGDPLPQELLESLPTARSLDLSDLGVHDLSPLRAARDLVELTVNYPVWLDTDTLSELRSLRALSMLDAWVEDLAFLEDLPELSCLALSRPPVQGWGELARLGRLRWLYVPEGFGYPAEVLDSLPGVTVLCRLEGGLSELIRPDSRRLTRPELLRAVGARERVEARDLTDLRLVQADLRGADLRDVDLSGADLRGADLSDAILEGCTLNSTTLCEARLRGARILRCSVPYGKLQDADLSGADLSGSTFELCGFNRARFSRARGEGVIFDDCGFNGAMLRGADLPGLPRSARSRRRPGTRSLQ